MLARAERSVKDAATFFDLADRIDAHVADLIEADAAELETTRRASTRR